MRPWPSPFSGGLTKAAASRPSRMGLEKAVGVSNPTRHQEWVKVRALRAGVTTITRIAVPKIKLKKSHLSVHFCTTIFLYLVILNINNKNRTDYFPTTNGSLDHLSTKR